MVVQMEEKIVSVKDKSQINEGELSPSGIEELSSEEEIEEREPSIIKATDLEDRVKVLFEIDKKTAKKLLNLCQALDCSKRQFITEALQNAIAKYEDIGYLDYVLKDDVVDSIIARLKEKQVTILMPKAYRKIRDFLKDKESITQGNKWQEFLRKMKLEDEENPQVAYFITWR
jgi:hypothetical protein